MSKDKFKKGKSMDDANVPSGNDKAPRADELVDVFNIPEKYTRLRFFGPIFSYGIHWVQTKKKDGSKTQFPTPCLAYDTETGKRDTTRPCPWCTHEGEEVRFSAEYWSNAIVRSLQKNKPERVAKPTKDELEDGFKLKETESWTAVRAVRCSSSVMKALKGLKDLNVHDTDDGSQGFSVSHKKFGCDIMIKKDKNASPANMYQIQKSDPKPLSKEEQAMLIYDVSELQTVMSAEDAQLEYDRWYERMFGKKNKKSTRDDDDEDDDAPKSKKKRSAMDDDEDDEPKSKKKSKSRDDDEDEDDEDEPKPKKKGKASRDDDDDEDDEDEDDVPAKKSKKKVVDEDDEEDDEPPKKSKKKKSEDFDDEDEDDEPPKKKKKPSRDDDEDDEDEPPKKSKKKSRDEDEDDEDDEPPKKSKKSKSKDDDEDDEDDEPPKKSKKKSKSDDFDDDDEDDEPKKKGKKSKKVVDDDDEDDDLDD